jgi:regulator of PEP synthase PpsR (kinase-PPPase family)
MPNPTVFFVSDGTGITAETFGNAILAQFEFKFRHIRLPFVDSVDKVRERTTGPILEIAKGTVQGVVGLMILTPIIVLAIAGMVRLLNWAIPGDVWIAYALMGLLLVLLGLFLWSKRFPRDI